MHNDNLYNVSRYGQLATFGVTLIVLMALGLFAQHQKPGGGGGGGGGGTISGSYFVVSSANYGPLYGPITAPPTASNFTADNQGTSTLTDNTDGGLIFAWPAGTGNNYRVYHTAAPATPYTRTICFDTAGVAANVGVAFRQSSNGRLVVLIRTPGGIAAVRYTSPTSFDSDLLTGVSVLFTGPTCFRIGDDGTTNRTYSVVTKLDQPVQVAQEGRTNFLTADQIAIVVNSSTSSFAGKAFYWHWGSN